MALTHAGLIKPSIATFPGPAAVVITTPGCNFSCPYCDVPCLARGSGCAGLLPIEELLRSIDSRRTMLRTIVISGGEPLVHENIGLLVDAVRSLRFSVRLETNGSLPLRLKALHLDHISMDIKTAPWHYNRVAPAYDERLEHNILASIRYIQDSGIPHDFRTVLVPGIVTEEDIEVITGLLKADDTYSLVRYRPGKTLDPGFAPEGFPEETLEEMLALARRKCRRARLMSQ